MITKEDEVSRVKELKDEERVLELARMISSEVISDEALKFAKSLLYEKLF